MTIRPGLPADETGDYISLSPNASQVAVTAVTEWTAEQDAEDEDQN
jgi:hypothetical protein